jgi:uncharacterized protein YdaU (DUF1376 family)
MPAGRPWYQRNPTDFIVGTMGWDLELRGAYSLLIDILNERDRPIPDDGRFVAGFLGISVRKWSQLRERLLDSGKIVLLADGCLSNPRFERERAQRAGEHQRSVEAGRRGGQISAARRSGQGEMPLENAPGKDAENPTAGGPPEIIDAENAAKTPRKRAENAAKTDYNSEFTDEERQNSAIPDQPPPQATRARVRDQRSEIRDREDSNRPANPTTAGEAVADRSDDFPIDQEALLTIVQGVARAGGVVLRPERPKGYVEFNVKIVKAWLADGIDIEQTALPAIAQKLARLADGDPPGSIKLYDVDVRKAHAKASGGKPSKASTPEERIAGQRSTMALYRRMGRHAEADEIAKSLPPDPT